jgi:RHS repeat-associated protein
MAKLISTSPLLPAANVELAEKLEQKASANMMAIDGKGSVLYTHEIGLGNYIYAVYGHAVATPLLGFNGERVEGLTKNYMLGLGHRMYSPTMMRFYSPDTLSPFEKGGMNAYAYCGNDPINRTDPTGRSWRSFFKGLRWPRSGQRRLNERQGPGLPTSRKSTSTSLFVDGGDASLSLADKTVRSPSVDMQQKAKILEGKILDAEIDITEAEMNSHLSEPFSLRETQYHLKLLRRKKRQLKKFERLLNSVRLSANNVRFKV